MSLKALAREAKERNALCNTPRNGPENRATPIATPLFDLEERAAIVQEGAQVPAAWAEGFARLEALPAPNGVNPATWLAMIDAAGLFLDQWGSQAAALGWSAGHLFGLDAEAPITRRDRRGAAFYLIGAEVLAVTADAIAIRNGGRVQHIYRRPNPAAPAWEFEP